MATSTWPASASSWRTPLRGAVEVIDGQALIGRPEASGVLCAQDEALVFAAARGAGKVLVIDPGSLAVVSEIATGPRPNGLACCVVRR